jgi:hypothetical protein
MPPCNIFGRPKKFHSHSVEMNGHPHQLLRMFAGKRAQENRIGNTVHRSSRADPKRNRKNSSRREGTATQQRSGRIPQVLVQTVEPNAYPSFPRLPPGEIYCRTSGVPPIPPVRDRSRVPAGVAILARDELQTPSCLLKRFCKSRRNMSQSSMGLVVRATARTSCFHLACSSINCLLP